MRSGKFLATMIGGAVLVCTLWAQKPFREYPGWEEYQLPLPPDYQVPGEWTFARLMYPTSPIVIDWQSAKGLQYDWHEGRSNWTIDYPRSDRHLAMAVRRLTRIQARSVEQPINLESDDDVFNYPWMYASEVGHWELTDQMVAKFREYIQRGGFFFGDDFHGTDEWEVFMRCMSKILPGREIVDIPLTDPIMHSVYDIDEYYQIPGMQMTQTHSVCEKCRTNPTYGSGGDNPHFRGIYDDHGRLVVVVTHNNDLGDSWENADDPIYPQKYSALGIRVGMNYVVYAMTH